MILKCCNDKGSNIIKFSNFPSNTVHSIKITNIRYNCDEIKRHFFDKIRIKYPSIINKNNKIKIKS